MLTFSIFHIYIVSEFIRFVRELLLQKIEIEFLNRQKYFCSLSKSLKYRLCESQHIWNSNINIIKFHDLLKYLNQLNWVAVVSPLLSTANTHTHFVTLTFHTARTERNSKLQYDDAHLMLSWGLRVEHQGTSPFLLNTLSSTHFSAENISSSSLSAQNKHFLFHLLSLSATFFHEDWEILFVKPYTSWLCVLRTLSLSLAEENGNIFPALFVHIYEEDYESFPSWRWDKTPIRIITLWDILDL